MSGEASCTCLHVEYRPVSHENGTKSDRWACQGCGSVFARFQNRNGPLHADLERLVEGWASRRSAPEFNFGPLATLARRSMEINGVLLEDDIPSNTVRTSPPPRSGYGEIMAAVALLRRLEWAGLIDSNGARRCPDCGGMENALHRHAPDCQLLSLIEGPFAASGIPLARLAAPKQAPSKYAVEASRGALKGKKGSTNAH